MRFVLVDYLHLAYKCYNMPTMSANIVLDGVQRVVDTVIPTITCKDVWRFSACGKYPTGVFMEGGSCVRQLYFQAVNEFKEAYLAKKGIVSAPDAVAQLGYKGDRKGLSNSQRTGVTLTTELLVRGQNSVYQVSGFEADDLIWTMVQQIKAQYPDAQIDIITCDMDMLPLVDDKVSVYMRGNRTYGVPLCGSQYCMLDKETCEAYAKDECHVRREFNNYYQVTPETWDDFISYRSAFKGVKMPYNAMYLYKMIRGDTSDNVGPAVKGYGPKKMNALFDKMQEDGVDIAKTFRYETPWADMEAVLKNYFNEEELLFIKLNAEGIRPRNDMSPLINLAPRMSDDASITQADTEIDVAQVYYMMTHQQTFTPQNTEQYNRAMMLYDAITKGITFDKPIALRMPVCPELGRFQRALTDYSINLPHTYKNIY